MKTLFYIIGGLVCVALIIAAMYVALTIGLSVYIAHEMQLKMKDAAAQQRAGEVAQMQTSISSLGTVDFEKAEKQRDQDEVDGKLPSLFSDPEGYGIEDNWLATTIGREIAEMAFYAAQPGTPLPDLKVKATVDIKVPSVHVAVAGWPAGPLTSDLTPVFAWDPNGYAPLARQLIGATSAVPEPELADNNVLANLLELTGPKLAEEDVQLSANLQAHPSSWQDHEAAALLLMALALRDEGNGYEDNRPLLCKATAHLALAQAWRGDAHPTWPGLIAGAAIRALSGREVDALQHLQNLGAQADLPEAAKSWISALLVRATQDWRKAEVTEKSPLLLKIVWLRILDLDLGDQEASNRLQSVVVQAPTDPNLPDDKQQINPETLLPDWSRIVVHSPYYDLSQDDVKNSAYRLDLEFHELDGILKVEKADPFDLNHLATVFAERGTDTIAPDAKGKTVARVIGPGGFKDVSRGFAFSSLVRKDIAHDEDNTNGPQDAAQVQTMFAKMETLFKDVPGYDIERLELGMFDDNRKAYADMLAAKKTWGVWEIPESTATVMPGAGKVKAFYRNAVPFGTVYDPAGRLVMIRGMDPVTYPSYNTPELEQIKKLPVSEAINAIGAYNKKHNELMRQAEPKEPTPFEQQLLALDPDEYSLVQDHIPNDKLLPVVTRFLDYMIDPAVRIENLDAAHLSEADREMVLAKHAALVTNSNPALADLLWKDGKDDEAAAASRKDLDDLLQPGASITMIRPLVEYDIDHHRYDEVESLAKRIGLDTPNGQTIHFVLLEESGRLDEAEDYGKKLLAEDKAEWPLAELYAGHRDKFPAQYDAEVKRLFPKGLIKVTLDTFTEQPMTAAVLSEGPDPVVTLPGPVWRMDRAGLQTNEVVVALDGYRVESSAQYTFIKAMSTDPVMDLIVYRKPKFVELKPTVPHRRLNMPVWNYLPAGDQ